MVAQGVTMPIYQWVCPDGHTTELMLSGAPPDVTECGVIFVVPEANVFENCGKPAHRVLSAPPVRKDGAYSYHENERT